MNQLCWVENCRRFSDVPFVELELSFEPEHIREEFGIPMSCVGGNRYIPLAICKSIREPNANFQTFR